MHALESGACSNEIVKYDYVRFFRQHIEREYGIYALAGMAESNILIKRDFQPLVNIDANKGGEIPFLMAPFWRGADTPIAGT